ncbi:hypothetical protein F5Y13DRAFT_154556 [Hypoxylon sp. FL1857]|nr:hypothetical protein F5Y13DRAFT_154556 [Hypoxylon sp. FL1857]
MISFNASCLPGRQNILPRTWFTLKPINVPSRASSLSAIHRGLRNSQKAKPQGFNKASLNTARSTRAPPPAFTISKGKKDITYTGPKPKSRRARFHDPDDPFGKNSLVYQLKGSNLRGNLAALAEGEGSVPEQRESRLTRDQFFKDFESNSERKSFSDKRNDRPIKRHDRTDKWNLRPVKRNDRTDKMIDRTARSSTHARDLRGKERLPFPSRSTRPPTERRSFDTRSSATTGSWARPPRNGPTSREDWREGRNSQPSRERQVERYDDHTPSHRGPSRGYGPIRIHRATAASQFLYGQSVVEAALKETTRKLYKLYLYCGENRKDESRITGLEKKAEQAGVPVTKVTDSDGLRMMDKMSEGRPHNGCILEASPLPQLPVKSLSILTEEPTSGFVVTLAHQSSEEAHVNGISNFIEYDLPPNRKPFVLLLDGIQDPGNLGAILRSAAFLGVNAVAITKGYSATLTSVALKASAGASEVVKLFSVDSVLDFLTRSKEEGWLVYAAVAPTDRPRGGKHVTLDRVDSYDPLSISPTILVIGSEGEGLTGRTRRMADYEVSIPNRSGFPIVESLNVSVATGILCSAFLKKQHTGGEFDKVIEPQEDESQLQLW